MTRRPFRGDRHRPVPSKAVFRLLAEGGASDQVRNVQDYALITVEVPAGDASPEVVARQLGVELADIDATYGIVAIDPERRLYAVRVRAAALPGAAAMDRAKARGPFSNPKIAPFGRSRL